MSRNVKHVCRAGRAGLLIMSMWLIVSCATLTPTPNPQNIARGSEAPAQSTPTASQTSGGSSGSSLSTPEPAARSTAQSPPPESSGGSNSSRQTESTGAGQSPGGRQSAPPAGSGSTSSTPPAPPNPQLTPAQIGRGILSFGAEGFRPVENGPRPVHLSRRLSASGAAEIFAVFAGVDTSAEAQISTLSDFSRLFKQELKPVAFSLVQFRESGGGLHEVRQFSLGKYLVFESLKIVPIRKGADLPFAVAATFQTQEGSTDEWVTFSDEGTSQITLQQTLSRSLIIEDIDNDGYIDIIIRERGIEEGTGYETFLTWYKWNGRSFKEYKTTNIVRNLRDFLGKAATLLSQDDLEQFYSTSLPSAELERDRKAGLSNAAIFSQVFHLVPSSPDNPNDPIGSLSAITQVIFPNIFENPFTEQDRHGYGFPMTVRFVTSDQSSHFYAAKIYMHKNPFVTPQFDFAVSPAKEPE